MTCGDYRDLLQELADRRAGVSADAAGAAPAAELRAAEAHIASCVACTREAALAGQVTALLRQLPVRAPRAGFDARVLAAFAAEQAAALAAGAEATAAVAAASAPARRGFAPGRLAIRTAGRIRQVALGAAATWGAIAAVIAVWVIFGGGAARLADLGAGVAGPAASGGVGVIRLAADALASIAVVLRIAGEVQMVLRASIVALWRALHAPTLFAVALAIIAVVTVLVRLSQTRSQRRTRNVHAFFVLA